MLDGIDANHSGAMDLPEFVRIQLFDQLFDGLADERLEASRLDASVFILGAKKQDVAGRDHPNTGADAGLYPAHVFAWLEGGGSESL